MKMHSTVFFREPKIILKISCIPGICQSMHRDRISYGSLSCREVPCHLNSSFLLCRRYTHSRVSIRVLIKLNVIKAAVNNLNMACEHKAQLKRLNMGRFFLFKIRMNSACTFSLYSIDNFYLFRLTKNRMLNCGEV